MSVLGVRRREAQEAVWLRGLWALGSGTSVCVPGVLVTDLATSVTSRNQFKLGSCVLDVAVVVSVMNDSGNSGPQSTGEHKGF